MDGLVLAVDIGTSSLKAALIDSTGTLYAAARCRFPSGTRLPEHWTGAFREAVAILGKTVPLSGISAVSVSGNGPTLVAVDKKGNAGPILLWNDVIPRNAPAPTPNRSIFIPRLTAFRTLFPDAWNASRFVLSGPEYLLWYLTGEAVTILPEARFAEAYWTDEALSRAGLDSAKLPRFVLPGTIVGNANECLPKGIPVIAGGPDFIVALVGTGTLEAGKACDRAGTSEGLNVCISAPVSHPEIRTLPSVIGGLWNAAYLLPETGARFHAWRKESGQGNRTYPEIMEAIEKGNDAAGKKLVEDIGRSVRNGVDLLRRETGMDPVFALSGGQARNEIWNRMKASMTGATFALMSTPDGELMGDAVIAFTALGAFPTIRDAAKSMVRVMKYYEPDPDALARCRENDEKR